MKTQKTILSLATAALAVWAVGCDNSKDASVTEQTKAAATGASDKVSQAAAAMKETGTKVVSNAVEQAKVAAAPASSKAQELIDSTKNLLGEGKFQDALAKLKEIGGEKLSLNQQTIVDGLKAQIEKALAATPKAPADASGAVGGLLKK